MIHPSFILPPTLEGRPAQHDQFVLRHARIELEAEALLSHPPEIMELNRNLSTTKRTAMSVFEPERRRARALAAGRGVICIKYMLEGGSLSARERKRAQLLRDVDHRLVGLGRTPYSEADALRNLVFRELQREAHGRDPVPLV